MFLLKRLFHLFLSFTLHHSTIAVRALLYMTICSTLVAEINQPEQATGKVAGYALTILIRIDGIMLPRCLMVKGQDYFILKRVSKSSPCQAFR